MRTTWRWVRFLGSPSVRDNGHDTEPGDAIGRALVAEPNIREVRDLHAWEISSGFPALTAHVLVAPGCDCHAARAHLSTILAVDSRSCTPPSRWITPGASILVPARTVRRLTGQRLSSRLGRCLLHRGVRDRL